MRIDHDVEIDFTGYKKLVGTLGGVRVNVPQDAAPQGVEGGAPPGPRPPITCSRSTTRPGRGGRAPAGNRRRERGPLHTDKPTPGSVTPASGKIAVVREPRQAEEAVGRLAT
ncbi:hypothetical protein [Streptomyces canus]|uniref:hypothetical protein n=1 Tax=Streptomyces canus TaxID=58343 RepID=UPI0036E35955